MDNSMNKMNITNTKIHRILSRYNLHIGIIRSFDGDNTVYDDNAALNDGDVFKLTDYL